MIILILSIIAVLVSIATIIFLYKLTKVLDAKFITLQTAVNERLETLDDQVKVVYEREDKNEERIGTIIKWCETLRENQDTLQSDLGKLYYGVKREVKKVEKLEKREQSEAQKPV